METKAFSFELPARLIAQYPRQGRASSRLLLMNRATGELSHHHVVDLPSLIPAGTVMVFNRSKVRKARLYARAKGSQRDKEFLLIDQLPSVKGNDRWTAMTNKVRGMKPGKAYVFPGYVDAFVVGAENELVELEFSESLTEEYFELHGHVPLPPYIRRKDETEDEWRYQTVYARTPGSVAAPTAGLHFTDELLRDLVDAGVQLEWIELHVGLGTFLPVRSANIDDHHMHSERYSVDPTTAERLTDALRSNRPVLAVGTTSVRTLEAAFSAPENRVAYGSGETAIFIRPGYQFGAVTSLFTNFHTPESTLLMLVAAFGGLDRVLAAYREAVNQGYRFFSYGDAMLIQ